MITLAIDTSSNAGSVAVSVPGSPAVLKTLHSLPGHSESLLYAIRSVLDEAVVQLGGVGLLAAGVGPGSFTGLRVGLAAMKGLCLATGRPLIGASSLLALGMNAAEMSQGRPVCAAIDARRGDLFAVVYRFEGVRHRIVVPEMMARPEGLLKSLSELGGEVVCVGDAFIDTGRGKLVGAVSFMTVPERAGMHMPSADNVARIARLRYKAGERDDAASLEPSYTRPVDFKKSA